MGISGNSDNKYLMVRKIGDVVVADTLNISLDSVQAILAWGEEMHELIGNLRGKKLVINLGCTDYAPGPILQVLSSINQYAANRKIKLALCDLGNENKRIFKLTRLNTVMTITDGEINAIKAVNLLYARR